MSDDLYNQIIRPNYLRLMEDARPDNIVDLLYLYGGIDFHDMEKISKITQNTGHRDGMKALLNILRLKRPEDVRMFVSVLGEAGYVDLQKQLKISEDRPLPEPTSTVLEKHSNRILQLEQIEAENKAEIENLKSKIRELKIQLLALMPKVNVKKEAKNQNEYRSQNQETRGQMPVTQPNPTKIELTSRLVALGFASMTPFSNESHHVTHSYSASYFSHCVQDKEARSINLGEKTMGYFNSLSLHPTVQELHCYPEEKITFNINSIFVDWCRNRTEEKIQEEKMKEEQRKMLEKEMCRILREEMIQREIMIKIMIEKERKMLEEYLLRIWRKANIQREMLEEGPEHDWYDQEFFRNQSDIGSMNRYVHPTVPEIQGYQEKRRTYNYMYLYIGPKHDWYDQASFRKHPWSILTKDEEEKEDRDWCRNRREERIQEEKMKEEQRKMLEKDARNLKQNMTSTVNKPYHQDGNQNTVYNHPDNKLPNPVVNREKRSDQKAKGVNIKIGKQAGEDAKQLNIMKGKFLLTLLFLSLSLTNVPVTSATSHDCKWLPTNKTVKGLYETDITLVWKYESSLKVEKIDISRIKTEYEKENVASWTPEKGSVASRLISTDVTLEHRKEGAVGTIILTLIRAFPVDFDKIYSCIISSEHELHSMDTELEAYKLEYWPVDDVVEGRPGQDVKLVWIYKYPLPVKFVSFYLDNDIQDEVLSWSSFGIYIIEDRYKNRVKFNMTSNNDQVEITLTLLKTTRDDYNHTYHSQAMAPKGYWTIKEIYLRPSPVEDVKTVSSRQQPSSASGLSRVSIFLVCFVWLLAVQI